MLEKNKIYQGDCLEVMKDIDDASIDMILCDLPYGTTACKWDNIIPFEILWEQYNRIVKNDGNIVLFANQPFTTKLIQSNIKNFKYNWIWLKNRGTGFQYAKTQPMRQTEDICVFKKDINNTIGDNIVFSELKQYFYNEKQKSNLSNTQFKKILGNDMASHYFTKGIQWCFPTKKDYIKLQSTGYFQTNYEEIKEKFEKLKSEINRINYYPQMIKLEQPVKYKKASSCNTIGGTIKNKKEYYYADQKYPTNVLRFKKEYKPIHPTQKPVKLLEYLIKTYTNKGELVLDNCIGSGSTAIACINTNRDYIGIELQQEYVDIANKRINELKHI